MEPLIEKSQIDCEVDQYGLQNPSAKSHIMINVLVLSVCLIISRAMIHANLLKQAVYGYISLNDVNDIRSFSTLTLYIGWPVIYGRFDDLIDYRWLFVNIFACIALLVATFLCIRSWLLVFLKSKQFSLANIFTLTTLVAFLFALITSEKAYGWRNHTPTLKIGSYFAISAYPVYDLIPISISIVCAAYVVLTALMQILKSSLKLFRR
jgi:hypothetical protein